MSSMRPSICSRSPTTWHRARVDLGRVGEPLLPVLGRRRTRRERRRTRRLPPGAQGAAAASTTTRGSATATFGRRYLSPPHRSSRCSRSGNRRAALTLIVQNAAPYTYFGDRPIEIAPGAALESGDLAGPRSSSARARLTSQRSRGARSRLAPASPATGRFGYYARATALSSDRSTSGALPVQVDGDYIGDRDEVDFAVVPRGLNVVS